MRKLFMAVPIVALTLAGSTACATKKFVRTSVGEVDEKVDTLSKSVEETQERVRQNEGRIAAHDGQIKEVDQRAVAAGQSAQDARAAADAVKSRTEEMDRAARRLVYEVVLSEDQGNFKFGQTMLPDEAKTELDKLVQHLQAEPKSVFIDIEGHTDGVGPKQLNERLGLERAEAVKRYLYEQHQVPLHKMNVISYGEDKPVAPNKTREGRAQNRRVVVKVLT
jgi:outer membrane protein OmpA-like peptidoglycan-associated protein